MAENSYVNKVVFGNDTLLDLTEDSVTANTLLEGETAHSASGAPVTGTAKQGHIIWNAIKTALSPQRLKLWFADAKVTDDSTEQATKVEVVQLIDDESELTNAPDGVYQGDYEDVPEVVLDASMVAYNDGSVEDALDELNLDSVSVTADGTKNERVLLNELFALIDITELNPKKSFIKTLNANGNYSVYRLNAVHLTYASVGAAYFTMEQIASNRLNVYSIILTTELSAVQAVEGGTFHDYSTEVESAGYKFILYY